MLMKGEHNMRFSIVTVCLNAEHEIERTLKSVLDQAYDDYEYIIIDGSSNDGTLSVIEQYIPRFVARDVLVTVVSEEDGGIAEAFNKGIRLAKGEVIALVNAGDCLLPDTLKYVSECMSIDILYGNIIWHDYKLGSDHIRKSNPRLSNLMYDMVITHPATFVRRDAYERVGLFDTSYRYCMDQELMVRMQQNGMRFTYVDKELARMYSGGISDSNLSPYSRRPSAFLHNTANHARLLFPIP